MNEWCNVLKDERGKRIIDCEGDMVLYSDLWKMIDRIHYYLYGLDMDIDNFN